MIPGLSRLFFSLSSRFFAKQKDRDPGTRTGTRTSDVVIDFGIIASSLDPATNRNDRGVCVLVQALYMKIIKKGRGV